MVNDLVNLSFLLNKNVKIRNFINAILRLFLREQEKIFQQISNNNTYQYDLPVTWIDKIKSQNPNDYQQIILNLNHMPRYSIRVNNIKISKQDYIEILYKQNVKFDIIDNIIVLNNLSMVNEIPHFNDGYVSIQDIHAQKLLDLIDFKDNELVLDACCAPGGKTGLILENYNNVNLTSLDVNKSRLEKVHNNLTRLNLKTKLIQGDLLNLTWWDNVLFDTIIADVPCSSSGTIKRNPDIKINFQLDQLNQITQKQQQIVYNLWKTLKSGGKLIYITCSIFAEENELNKNYFIKNILDLKLCREIKYLPSIYGDGFYYCVFQKVN